MLSTAFGAPLDSALRALILAFIAPQSNAVFKIISGPPKPRGAFKDISNKNGFLTAATARLYTPVIRPAHGRHQRPGAFSQRLRNRLIRHPHRGPAESPKKPSQIDPATRDP